MPRRTNESGTQVATLGTTALARLEPFHSDEGTMIRYHILGQQGFRQVKLVRESSEAAVQTVRYLLDYGWQVTITSKLRR